MPYSITRTIPDLYRLPKSAAEITVERDDLDAAVRHIMLIIIIIINTGATCLYPDEATEVRNAVRESMRKRRPQTWTHNPSGYVFTVTHVKKVRDA